jgi:enoyl-[acyl-carrier-protein] reductase (NADH)
VAGLLDGKRLLITGVITDASIAFHVARVAQEQGARVLLTGHGRVSLVEHFAQRLPRPAPVLELDVADQGQLDSLAQRVREHVDGLDGVLHSIAFAPASCLGGEFLNAPWSDVATALQISAYSFKSLALACLPLLARAGSIVGWTSTTGKLGPPMTGWVSRNPRWSRCAGIWPEIWVPTASGSTWWRPGRCAPWRPSRFLALPRS